MGFILTLLYLLLSFVPPAEIHRSLAQANVMDVLGIAALATGLLGFLIARTRRQLPIQLFLVIALLLWAAATVVLALRWFGGAVMALQGLVINFALFWLLTLTVDSRRKLRAVLVVLVGTLMILLALGIRDLRTGSSGGRFVFVQGSEGPLGPAGNSTGGEPGRPEPKRRLMALGFLADPNQLAQVLVATIPLVFAAWRRRRPIRNIFGVLLPVGVLTYGLVLTQSRGGVVALGALLCGAALLQHRRWLKRTTAIALIAVLPLGLFLARRTAQADDSAHERVEAWSYGLQLLKASPLWGNGFGTFMEGHYLTAHNSFVLCFAELGLVGYSLWLAIFLVSYTQLSQIAASNAPGPAGREIRRWAAVSRLCLIAFLAAGFFLSRTFSVMLFLVVGLATAVVNVADRNGISVAPLHPIDITVKTGFLAVLSILLIYAFLRLVY